jgi:hypothetical protein
MSSPDVKLIGWRDDWRQQAVLLTPWSLSHFACGLLVGSASFAFRRGFKASFVAWSLLHLCYEATDVYMAYSDDVKDGAPNSFANSVADQAVAMLGFLLAWYARLSMPVAVTAALLMYFVLISPYLSPEGTPTSIVGAWYSRG